MSKADVAATRVLLDSFMSGDIESALGAIHPDCVVREAAGLPFGGHWKGPDGFGQLLGTMAKDFEVVVEGYELFDAGEVVVGRLRATFRSQATGASVALSIVELYTIRDGRIVDVDVYYKDTLALRDLLEH